MNRIVEVLMKRDGLTEVEAKNQVQIVQASVYESLQAGCFDEVEDILATELGLEMDYIEDLL